MIDKSIKNEQARQQINNTSLDYLKIYNYQAIKLMGSGGYGVVYKAKLMNTNIIRAIKISYGTVQGLVISAEIAFLKIMQEKPRLPKIVDLFVYHGFTHIVMEYYEYKPYLQLFETIQFDDIKHYLYELLLGLKELKDLGIYHRDIKPSNFLYNPMTKRGIIIDFDFGLSEIDEDFQSRLLLEQSKYEDKNSQQDNRKLQQIRQKIGYYKKASINNLNKIGTWMFAPLETLLKANNQTYSSDMWSVGIIMLQFIVGKIFVFEEFRKVQHLPYKPLKNSHVAYLIQLASFFEKEYVIEECRKYKYKVELPTDIKSYKIKQISNLKEFQGQMQDLFDKIFRLDPQLRISVEEALSHNFFRQRQR